MADGEKQLEANEAAGQGRRLRMWRPGSFGPNSALNGAGTMLSRARHAVRNDAWAGTAIERRVSNGVGCGIQAKPLWGTQEQKKAQSRLWKRWMRVADAAGAVDFYGLQALAWREWDEAGEVFARKRSRRESDGLPVPLQIQLIESEQVPRELNQTAPNGNVIRQGIEFDRIGRPAAYWVHPQHPGDELLSNFTGNAPVRIPAEQIIHLFRPLRAGQIRGTPVLSPVLVELFNHKNLRDATLERVKIANLFAGWYVRVKGEATEDSVAEDMKTGEDEDGIALTGLEPGTMQELPVGVEPKFSTPPDPGTSYAEFVRHGLLAIAARIGVPIEVLTGDLRDISDRALKLALNEFRRLIEMDQWLYMIPQFCQGIRDAWFDAAVLSGALDVDDYATVREDVVETLWVPQGWPYSHPVQDVDADTKAIRAGLTSRTKTVLKQGEDPDEVDAEQAADNARADTSGLRYDSDGRQPRTTAAKSADRNEEETK